MSKWTPEDIDRAFDKLTKELGRPPKLEEFLKRYPQAYYKIALGRYPGVWGWNEYRTKRGFEPERFDV